MVDLYATIYVRTELQTDEVSKIVGECINGVPDAFNNIDIPELSVSVRDNPDLKGSYFGSYNLIIEFEPVGNQGPQEAASRLENLLVRLWDRKMRTETSCDYEELLPHNGRFDGRINEPIVYDDED